MELVDDNKAGDSNKLELSNGNIPYIGYLYNYNSDKMSPIIAQRSDNTWSKENLSVDDMCLNLNFSLDSADSLHLSFTILQPHDEGLYKILYTTNRSGTWENKIVTELTSSGAINNNMNINHNNNPYVVYEEIGINYSIYFAQWNGDGWDSQYLADGRYPILAIDSNDNFHIVYTLPDDNNYKDELFYLTDITGEWVTTKIDDTDDCDGDPGYSATYFSGPQLEIDDQDNLHLAYTVNYFTDADSQSGWDCQTKYVEIGADGKNTTVVENHAHLKGLALDSDANPHLLLGKKEEDKYPLHVYSKSGSAWESINLGIVTGDSDLEVDSNGYFHISFAVLDDLDVPIALYYLTDRPE